MHSRNIGEGYIIELDNCPVFMIKQEVKMMSLDEAKQLASDTIEDFKQNEDIDEIMYRSIEKLNISDDDQHFSFKLELADLNHDLFLDLQRFGQKIERKEHGSQRNIETTLRCYY